MPNRSHISASSFTRPMLTARNVFSSSFTISATSRRADVDDGVDRGGVERAWPARAHAGVMPPTTFGTFLVVHVALPGIDALGREGQKEILARPRGRGVRESDARLRP